MTPFAKLVVLDTRLLDCISKAQSKLISLQTVRYCI